MGGMMEIEFIEDDETIRLIVRQENRETTLFLDADDDRWKLILGDDQMTLLTSTNGDFNA